MNKISSNAQILKAVSSFGAYKSEYTLLKTFLLGFMGGLYISLAGIGNITVNAWVGGGLGVFLGAMIFPVGIIFVALVGGSLFTGDALKGLFLIEGKMSKRRFFKNLFTVWFGNLCGALFIVALVLGSAIFNNEVFTHYIVNTSLAKLQLGAVEALCSGFLCNILVAGAIWFSLSTKDLLGKVVAIYLPIMLFVICGYQHVVANMFYINLGIALNSSIFDLADYLRHFGCVTIGNFLAGAVFLPLIYHIIYRKA